MLVCYALEDRSHWFVLAFAGACALGSVYGFLQGAWPFGVVEAIWAVVALRRWQALGWPGSTGTMTARKSHPHQRLSQARRSAWQSSRLENG